MLELALANYKLALIDYELALIDYKLGSFQGVTSHYLKQCWPMMTSSNGNIFHVTGHLCGEFTAPREFPHKGQWRGALMFSLICVWINDWVNNGEAGNLRRYRIHYDVIVMPSAQGPLLLQSWFGYVITFPVKCGIPWIRLLTHPKASTVQPLKFGNG